MVRGENSQPKVIVMVRDLRDVFCSMEKKFRENPDKAETTRDWATMRGATIPERVDIWANTPPVGLALKRLQEIISFGNDKHMLFIKYEDLCLNPEQTMNRVYNYLGIPHFNHNFDFIEQVTHEDDTVHGEYGDHTIRNKLEMLPSDANRILGEGVTQWIMKNYMWFFRYFNYIKDEPRF
jgi:sulfotransferase